VASSEKKTVHPPAAQTRNVSFLNNEKAVISHTYISKYMQPLSTNFFGFDEVKHGRSRGTNVCEALKAFELPFTLDFLYKECLKTT
jgi:hypothetical protein